MCRHLQFLTWATFTNSCIACPNNFALCLVALLHHLLAIQAYTHMTDDFISVLAESFKPVKTAHAAERRLLSNSTQHAIVSLTAKGLACHDPLFPDSLGLMFHAEPFLAHRSVFASLSVAHVCVVHDLALFQSLQAEQQCNLALKTNVMHMH